MYRCKIAPAGIHLVLRNAPPERQLEFEAAGTTPLLVELKYHQAHSTTMQ